MTQRLPMPERHAAILQTLGHLKEVTVGELSARLGVSEVSIRRDFDALERQGLLRRTRGGAEATLRPGQTLLFDARLLMRPKEKRAIGAEAVALIHPGDTILLDSGSTVLEIARALPQELLSDGGLTVVTRSLMIAGELRRHRSVRLIVLGGVYLHDYDDFVGSQVEEALDALHVRTLFVGADGISLVRGVTTENALEAGLYRKMVRVAQQVVVVTDSSKIGLDRLEATLPIEEIHTFITDAHAPRNFIASLRERGIDVRAV